MVFSGKLSRGVVLALWVWLGGVVAMPARTVPDPSDATGFFTTVADKLLRSTFSFGITNIPVQTNGVFVYTPAVQRLLQVAANLRDAATTNFYPTVFRPIFYRDPSGNIYITGYQQVAGITGVSDPQFTLTLDISALPYGVSSNANVYGVPWIIGAKQNLPNFNEFYSYNTMQVTRLLQFNRQSAPLAWTGNSKSLYSTNQLLIMSITNHFGFNFWNSYTSNYPGQPTVCVQDVIHMRLSCGSYSYLQYTNFFFTSSPNPWPGSGWNLAQTPVSRQANPGSFIGGTFDFPFVPEAALDLDQNGKMLGFQSETFQGTPITLPTFPNFEEDTTNWFQAYIMDNGHVLDYVQFTGPTHVRYLGSDLMDPNSIAPTPSYMWSTNLSGTGNPPSGVNWGVVHQINISQTGLNIPPGSWQDPPNMPPGLAGNKAAEAAMFEGFFLPTWQYGGKTYVNTNLSQLAPFTPTRTVVSPTLWMVNDPLVHYLSSDLNQPASELAGVTNGVEKSDDPTYLPVAYPALTAVADNYQPWGRNTKMNGVVGVLQDATGNASYNLAYRDPLVWSSDDWNFPATNTLPLTTLGQVHRGTPWQTIYLKSTNLLDYVDPTQTSSPYVGLNTWEWWTGDFSDADAAMMAPVSDWRLAALIAELFNTNDATQLTSVNAGPAAWLEALDGITVLTNSTAPPFYYSMPLELDSVVMTSNSPTAAGIASALAQAQAAQPGQTFVSVGNILNAPQIAEASPWLSIASVPQYEYTISDAAYEAIPAQLLSRLRPDSAGGIVLTNGTVNIQFSGGDGFAYAVQTSTNFVDWVNVCTNQPSGGVFNFPIMPDYGNPDRFYRSVLLP